MFLFSQWKLKQHKPRLTETAVNIDPAILGYIQCVDFKTIIVYSPLALSLKSLHFLFRFLNSEGVDDTY